MKKVLVAALVTAGLFSAGIASADDTGLMVRARAVNLNWDNGHKDALPSAIKAEDRWIPEVDVSYFFTKNLAAELVLTYPQEVDVKSGSTKLGHVDALPPSLMLQYHFSDLGAFKPYVGAGLNYTLFTKKSFDVAGLGKVSLDQSSWGLAGQVGFDYFLTKNVALNVDVKYIKMETDVKVDGGKIGKLELSPITAGVGVGYRF